MQAFGLSKNIVCGLSGNHYPYHYISKPDENQYIGKRTPEYKVFIPVKTEFKILTVIE